MGGVLRGERLEGDLVSECLELGDQPFRRFLGVAALEVVAAEVAVELAGCEHVPAGADDRVLDGAEGFLWPRRGRSRWYWAAR